MLFPQKYVTLTSYEDYILQPSTVIKRWFYSLTTHYISHFPDWIFTPKAFIEWKFKVYF